MIPNPNTNPANPNFPGASGYVSVVGNLMTAIPKIHLADPVAVRKLASTLSALFNAAVLVVPDQDYPNVQPAGPLQALDVKLPNGEEINAGWLLSMPGKFANGQPNGAWGLDSNGAPEWQFGQQPAAQPSPVQPTPIIPPQLGGATAPAGNPNVDPIVAAINALGVKIDQALAKLPPA